MSEKITVEDVLGLIDKDQLESMPLREVRRFLGLLKYELTVRKVTTTKQAPVFEVTTASQPRSFQEIEQAKKKPRRKKKEAAVSPDFPFNEVTILSGLQFQEPMDFTNFCDTLDGGRTLSRDWFRSIFPLLRKAEREGLVEVKRRKEKGQTLVDSITLTLKGATAVNAMSA